MCVFKVNSNIMDKSNDLKQMREQIRKVDERLDSDMQVEYILLLMVQCFTELTKYHM